jgi:Ceramidase
VRAQAGRHIEQQGAHGESRSRVVWLFSLITLVGIGVACVIPRIAQDPAYHRFVDTRTIAGVPNFWDVASNFAFVLVGLYGLSRVSQLASAAVRPAYITFCIAVIAVAFGSGYYHYAPSTPSLVWDRLPMAVAFMALFACVLCDRTRWNLTGTLLWALVAVGVASVVYWAWTESLGRGDLRPYALVQFLPLILMPLMLLLLPGSVRSEPWLWSTFAAYFLAKVTEYFDAPIYYAIGLSGHTIKHLLSALAVLFAIFALLRLQLPRRFS